VKLPVVDRIHPQSNKFATGLERLQVTQYLMTALGGVGPFHCNKKVRPFCTTSWTDCFSFVLFYFIVTTYK